MSAWKEEKGCLHDDQMILVWTMLENKNGLSLLMIIVALEER